MASLDNLFKSVFGETAPWYFRLFVYLLLLCTFGMLVCVWLEWAKGTAAPEMLYAKAFSYFGDGFKVALGATLGALAGIAKAP